MSGIANFDPDRFVAPEPAKVVPIRTAPPEWEHGLELLADRALPRGAEAQRWAQIVADARRLATHYACWVIPAGWSIENLFGFDLDGPGGALSLAVAMRGRQLIHIDAQEAWLKAPGRMEFHRPMMPAGSPLLWTFNDRTSGK